MDARELLEHTLRQESGRILAGLIGRLGGDFGLAEEALQEACATALEHWPRNGVPERPGAWLTTTALREARDLLRRERRRRAPPGTPAPELLAAEPDAHALERLEEAMESRVNDDLLRLVFTCCHPALGEEARVALTLRTLGGLTTAEIARAFLRSEATLAQRLVRAQQKILAAAIPYRVPPAHELAERLEHVLAVVYLVFNEGYSATAGEVLVRPALCAEALRLARLLAELLPGEAEVAGLLALLCFQDSRRAARIGPDGLLVSLEEQDRARWDHTAIAEGERALARARAATEPGPYALQAAIAFEHARAPTAAHTDWQRIVALYDTLLAQRATPVVALNRAAALAMAAGPEAGLAELDELARQSGGALEGYLWRHTLEAELCLRLGRRASAQAAFTRALALAGTEPERRFLAERLRRLG